jgi:hypothetical protein
MSGFDGVVRLPFGQYRGQPLSEVNSSYLAFVAEQWADQWPGLCRDIQDELNRREQARRLSDPARLVRRWKRTMLARHGKAADVVIEDGAEVLAELLAGGG